MKKKVFRINLFLLLILVMLLSASCGKNRATTMKLIKTDGEVGVENEKGKSVDLIDNLGLYSGYGIGTQTKSFAWIDLDDTKLTKMDEKSDVDIIKDGKKLELVVNSGGLFFNVTKPLEDDESMDIRTSTTICGIRGTCGWVESRGDTSYIGLLDGKVESSVTVDGKEETVKINAKEFFVVKKDGDNVTYEVKELTYKDVPEFVQVEIADETFALEEETDNETEKGIQSLSELSVENRRIVEDALNDKFQEAINNRIDFIDEEAIEYSITSENASFDNFTINSNMSRVSRYSGDLYVPFFVDINDWKNYWDNTDFNEEMYTKSYQNVTGYFLVHGLEVMSNGMLSEYSIDISSLYQDEKEMKKLFLEE